MERKPKPGSMEVNDARRSPQGDRSFPERRWADPPGPGRKTWPLPLAAEGVRADALSGRPASERPTAVRDARTRPASLETLRRRELELVGGLGEPRPMPWLAWSISAERCNVGLRLRKVPGSVCSECYAVRSDYAYPVVRAAMERRYGRLEDLDRWTEDMASCLVARAARFRPTTGGRWPAFRWFDSGDLQGVGHLRAICRVAELTQAVRFADGSVEDVRHWLPTHEYPAVKEFLAGGGVFPRNLCVRVSAAMIDGPPIEVAGLPVSTTHSRAVSEGYPGAFSCPSDGQGGCGLCRACWDRDVKHVSYPGH